MDKEPAPYLLPTVAQVPALVARAVANDYERFADSGPPAKLGEYLAEKYQLDLSAEYAGYPLKNPWGKASGQLSMTARQVAEDVEAGLGFVVLKTVIAEDASGKQMMEAWAIKESRMQAETIVGESGETGWTISWKGRGWWHSFDDYLQLIRDALAAAQGSGTLIVPSCKYHLPTPDEDAWKVSEYDFTTERLWRVWRECADSSLPAMPLEKDFSPTLAGSDRAAAQRKILEWLHEVPRLIHGALAKSTGKSAQIRLGLKIFNALFDDTFQVEMLKSMHDAGANRPEFFIYGNRLFDPDREFDGHRGIAYGGPDLSDRNLRTMDAFLDNSQRRKKPLKLLPWSATGNITTGRMAIEYALRGASSFQLHTFFQLPGSEYRMKGGSKIQKALHELYFHPQHGFIVWLHHLAGQRENATKPIRFLDYVGPRRDS